MLNSLNTAATGMTSQAKQLEVIANNLANADTVSFKKSRAEFSDLLYQNSLDPGAATSATTMSPTGIQVGAGSRVVGTSRDHSDGSLRPTNRNLDFAINGDGFFSVQKPNGDILFTRDGSFKMDAEGRLVNALGYPVVPEITVPQGAKDLHVTPDGRVQVVMGPNEIQEIGQIQLTAFVNSAGLQAMGGNLYAVTPASGQPIPGNPGENGVGVIFQKYLEASNVQPVTEMTDMVRAQRVYELNSKVISTTDQMLQTLGQIR